MTPEQQAMVDRLAFKVMGKINEFREENLAAIRAWYVKGLAETDPSQAADIEGNADRLIAALRLRLEFFEAMEGRPNG